MVAFGKKNMQVRGRKRMRKSLEGREGYEEQVEAIMNAIVTMIAVNRSIKTPFNDPRLIGLNYGKCFVNLSQCRQLNFGGLDARTLNRD